MDEQLYKELIIEQYRNPMNTGRLEDADFTAKEHNPACGDEVELFICMDEGRVADVRHDSKGCAISQASASLLSEELKGKTEAELHALTKEDVLDMLGITTGTTRLRCALLPLETLRKALKRATKA